jgi:hypothetical protein
MEGDVNQESLESITFRGAIVQGKRATSGAEGTISRQRRFFISHGVKRAEGWYLGTININIAPREFEILKADYVVAAKWHPDSPDVEETFWLVDVTLEHKGEIYPAYLYYPCPSQFKAHPNTIMEILAAKIEGLEYGDIATVTVPRQKVC